MNFKQFKLLICGLASLLFSVLGYANNSQQNVEREFFILEGETQVLLHFFDQKHFENCQSKKTTAYLHYQLGEMSLHSAKKIDGSCAVMFQHETELGEMVETLCDLDSFQNTDFLNEENDEMRLSPPYCQINYAADQDIGIKAIPDLVEIEFPDVDSDELDNDSGSSDVSSSHNDAEENNNAMLANLFSFFLSIFLDALKA
ncbi:MAG: hypothetical protein AAGF06_05445 [Pseudomonadota bacterium]